MATSSFTAARAFRAGFLVGAQSVVDTDVVTVTSGAPGPEFGNVTDWVSLMDIRSEQSPGPLGTSRPRDEILTLTVWIGAFRPGGVDQEQVASDAAYALLEALDHYTRQTDTTVGGTVWWCNLTGFQSAGATAESLLDGGTGRLIEIEATFTARVRITGA